MVSPNDDNIKDDPRMILLSPISSVILYPSDT